jgi:hypothetical protein
VILKVLPAISVVRQLQGVKILRWDIFYEKPSNHFFAFPCREVVFPWNSEDDPS